MGLHHAAPGKVDPVEAVFAEIGQITHRSGQRIGPFGPLTRDTQLFGTDGQRHRLPDGDRRAQKPGLMMASIYRTLLKEIAADPLLVLTQRVSLTPLRKFWLAWKVQALGRL